MQKLCPLWLSEGMFTAIASLLCFIAFVGGIYIQEVYAILPCELCVKQRVIILLLFLSTLIWLIIRRQKCRNILTAIHAGMAFWGAYLAIYQVYIQWFPNYSNASCGMAQFKWRNYPLISYLEPYFKPQGSCSVVEWYFMDILSIPQLSSMLFIFLFLGFAYFTQKKIGSLWKCKLCSRKSK